MVHSRNTMATLFFCLKHCLFLLGMVVVERSYLYFSKTNTANIIYWKKSLIGLANFWVSSIFQTDVSGTVAVLVGMSIWEDRTLMLSRDTW